MLEQYRKEAAERAIQGVPALPLNAEQTRKLAGLLTQGHTESTALLGLLADRVEPGVSKAAAVKAEWLEQVALSKVVVEGFPPTAAIAMLAQMGGGYNVAALLRLLRIDASALAAADALKGLTKIYEAFDEVVELAKQSPAAQNVLESWAAAEWFTRSPQLPEEIQFSVYKVEGEINTDDFSPGNQAQSRADIPLHAMFFGKTRFPEGIGVMAALRAQGKTVAFAGDVVGTGSSRKSAINSVSWLLGEDIPHTPNKRRGGLVLGGSIAPIFYATARDAGVLAIGCDVTRLQTGDQLVLNIGEWSLRDQSGTTIPLEPAPTTLLDEYRAGGRLNLIIGCNLTRWACAALGLSLPFPFQDSYHSSTRN